MIGLGVGIDYALFVVTRFRQNMRQGVEPTEAVDHRRWTPPGAPCCSPASP